MEKNNDSKIKNIKILEKKGIKYFTPIKPNQKKAYRKNWNSQNHRDAFTADQMISFLKENPLYNYGIPTKINNLIILDVDGEAGKESIKNFLGSSWLNIAGNTLTVVTGGGGYHFYYFIPEIFYSIHSTNNGSKLDIISNTQVVGPGSTHIDTGKEYLLVKDLPVSYASGWFELLCKSFKEPIKENEEKTEISVNESSIYTGNDPIYEGDRDNTLFRSACVLRDRNIPIEDAIDIIRKENKKCIPQLSDKICKQKVESAYSYTGFAIQRTVKDIMYRGEIWQWFKDEFNKTDRKKAVVLFGVMYDVSNWGDKYTEIGNYRNYFANLAGYTKQSLAPVFNKFEEKKIYRIKKIRLTPNKDYYSHIFLFTPERFKS